MKNVWFSIIIITIVATQTAAQSITQATIGSSSGRLYGGNLMLNFTIGESFVTTQSAGNIKLENGFWAIVPSTYIPVATIVYRFTGNGNFTNAANWQSNIVPPNPLPAGSEIIIEPVTGGQCVLDTTFHINTNARFVIKTGCKFIIPGNLILN